MALANPQPDAVPSLDVGINLLEVPIHRTTALHQVALSHLKARRGTGVWLDARGNAATYLLDDEFRPTTDLDIARAFTAYQHYELVRTLPGDLPADLELVVLPCVASLYADNDVPEWAGAGYLDSSLAILEQVASIADVPVLVSCAKDSAFIERVRAASGRIIRYDRTPLGFRFETEGFETTVYWDDGFWQTTIPYWVELLGAVEDATPAVTAADEGLVPATV